MSPYATSRSLPRRLLVAAALSSWLLAGTASAESAPGTTLVVGPMDGCDNNNLCCKACDSSTNCQILKCERPGPATETRETCPTGSLVAFNLRYRHFARDYQVTDPAQTARGGCAPCGRSGPSDDTNSAVGVDLLRVHFPDTDLIGSFGPAWGCNWDIWLRCYPPGEVASGRPTGVPGWQILVQQPNAQPIDFFVGVDGDGDGSYADNNASFFRSLRFFTAAGVAVRTPDLASYAILTTHEGETFRFEMFREDPAAPDNLLGRFTRFADRNGRSIASAYKYAVNDPALTGTLRTKLRIRSRVTDSYGRSLAFTYNETAQVSGQWVVTGIDLPTGGHLSYRYGPLPTAFYGVRDTLVGVTHPDGSVSTFTAAIDPALSCLKWTCDDPAAEATSRRKTVWFSTSPWKDPADPSHQVSQIFDRVRQVANGAGEIAFQALIKHVVLPSGSTEIRTYFYDQGRLYAIVHGGGDALTARYDRTPGDGHPFVFLSTDWSGWVKTKSWTPGPNRSEPAVATDGVGRTTSYARTVTDQATQVLHPDGTSESWSYNQFTEPLLVIDRLGRRTQYAYDAAGNLLSLTVAATTGAAATTTWTYWSAADTHPERGRPGQRKSRADANGNVTEWFYFPNGDLKRVVEPPDAVGGPRAAWSHAYDAAGRRTSSTDPVGRLVRYAWDARSRLVDVGFADGSHETMTYAIAGSEAGLMTQRTDRNGNRTTFAHDAAGRLTVTTEAAGTPSAVTTLVTYLRGNRSLPASEARRGEAITYAYDSRLRRTAEARQVRVGAALITATAYDNADRPIITTDAYGRRTLLVYDVDDRLTRIVRELVPGGYAGGTTQAALAGAVRSLVVNPPYIIEDTIHDAEGQITARIDGRGIRSTMAYDAQGRLIATVEADAIVGPTGAASLLAPPEAARTEYTWDALNQTRITLPRSFVRTLPSGTWSAGPDGQFATTMTYTGRNLRRTEVQAAGLTIGGAPRPERATTTWTYTPTRQIATVTDQRGFATSNGYGVCCDRLVSVTDPAGFITAFGYDSFGNRTSATDANGLVTTMAYDGLQRVVAMTNGASETTRYAYDDSLTDGVGLDAPGSPLLPFLAGLGIGAGSDFSAVRSTNPEQEPSYEIHDGLGRLVRRVDPLGHAVTITYDQVVAGLVETATSDALGHVTRRRGDAAGRVRVVVDPLGNQAMAGFDASGNLVRTRDANGVGMDCVFDARNRETACTDTRSDVATTRSRSYDSQSNAVTETDALGNVTRYTYDARDRRIRTVDRIGGTTAFTYDLASNLTRIQDADALQSGNGQATDYAYDNRGLLIQELFPAGQAGRTARSYGYDAGRRLTSRTVGTSPASSFSERTTYAYDNANRLIVRGYPAEGKNDTFGYDHASRLLTASSARYRVDVIRAYDDASRLLSDQVRFLDGSIAGTAVSASTSTTAYQYDAADRQVRVTYPDGSAVDRTFTVRNELDTIRYAGALVADRGYDAGGRLTSTLLGNGLTETRAYLGGSDLVDTIIVPGVSAFDYAYDADRRQTAEANAALSGLGQAFAYDQLDRLISWSKPAGGAQPAQAQTWTLTKVGDWAQTVINGATQVRAHDPVHEVVTVGGAALTYDAKGNLTRNERGTIFTWDAENRLMTATIPALAGDSPLPAAAAYRYDALGRRVASTVNGRTTRFLHDGAQVVREIEMAAVPSQAEVDGAEADGSAANAALAPTTGGLLRPASGSVTRIDFQPVASAIPPGYLADKGRLYGVRTNGRTYGWTVAQPTARQQERAAPTLPELNTCIRVRPTPADTAGVWEIALPNGSYPVIVVCGDPLSTLQTNALTIEGAAVTDPDPSTAAGYTLGDFDGYALQVTVADGRLTITTGAGAADPKLCFVEIGPVGTTIDGAASGRLADLIQRVSAATYQPALPATATRNYVYGSYVDELLALIAGGGGPSNTKYAHSNHLFSIAALTDANGAVVERYRYDAYGQRTVLAPNGMARMSSLHGNQIGFTGRNLDRETGLWYFRARYYGGSLGRFLNRDPLGYTDGMGSYSANFVPNATDPSGEYVKVFKFQPYLIIGIDVIVEYDCKNEPKIIDQNMTGSPDITIGFIRESHSITAYLDHNSLWPMDTKCSSCSSGGDTLYEKQWDVHIKFHEIITKGAGLGIGSIGIGFGGFISTRDWKDFRSTDVLCCSKTD